MVCSVFKKQHISLHHTVCWLFKSCDYFLEQMYTKEFHEAKLIILIKPMFKRFNEQDAGDDNALLTQAKQIVRDLMELLPNGDDEDTSDNDQLFYSPDSSHDEGKNCLTSYLKTSDKSSMILLYEYRYCTSLV